MSIINVNLKLRNKNSEAKRIAKHERRELIRECLIVSFGISPAEGVHSAYRLLGRGRPIQVVKGAR